MGGAGAIPMNPDLLVLAENGDPKAVDLMMDWAHGPAGHFGGHPVPGLYHINTGTMLAKSRTIQNTLGVDFRACDNYKNGFEAAKKIKCPTLSILAFSRPSAMKRANSMSNICTSIPKLAAILESMTDLYASRNCE